VSTIIRHVNRKASPLLRAAESALMRWYPRATLARIQQARRFRPGYPLIHGGSPRPVMVPGQVGL
jgi:hypothetical protein